MVGGSIAALAIVWGDFVMFCIGTLIAGFYGSYVQSYRFAATDSATPAFRARAISYVLAGGLAAGILGPQVVIFTRDMVPGATFAGSFMAQATLALIAIMVISFLAHAARSGDDAGARRCADGVRATASDDHAAAPFHHRGNGGRGFLWPDGLPDDGGAAGHG